jgi:WD40 repeat protein
MSGNFGRIIKYPSVNYSTTGSSDTSAILWDLKGHIVQKFRDQHTSVTGISYSPDGKWMLSSSGFTTSIWTTPLTLEDFLQSNEIEPLTPMQKEKYKIY